MTSADNSPQDFTRALNSGLQRIAGAQGRDGVLQMMSKVAHDLTEADGLCALPRDGLQYQLLTSDGSEVLSVEVASALQRLIASAADARDAIIQHRPDMEVELPIGKRVAARTILTVPLDGSSAYRAIGFFWSNGTAPDAERLALLPTVALTGSIALRAQQHAEESQQHRERQRQQVIELQHRARNVLALVRSIIRRSGQTAESIEDFASHLEARISALSRTQSALSIEAGAGPELEDLIRSEMTANAARENQFVISGPSLRLATRAAETMALALHELTTNALKFGALATSSGLITVSWSIDEAPARLRLRWVESGVGMTLSAPPRRGFGQELIERVLPYELGARTSFALAPGGVQCEIDMPLNERTACGERAWPTQRERSSL